MSSNGYAGRLDSFLHAKTQHGGDDGFDPLFMPDWLFPFQQMLCEWSIRKGRGAVLADCGLGKTPMQLVWAQNILQKTNKPVLVLTPLAVAGQTAREADKFSIDAEVCRDGKHDKRIVITNYERLHYFDPENFAGLVCDESSILKNFDGKRKAEITEFARTLPYRSLWTATAAPNDFDELGTSSEALGYLGYHDMLSRFFRQQTKKDHRGWGRTKYILRGHAEDPFWRWVCSWSRAIRKPSDYGFSDDGFELPDLIVREQLIDVQIPRKGMLLAVPARNRQEQLEERRISIKQRCERAAELSSARDCSVSWCHLNPEGDLLEKMIDGAVQVSGKDSDESKEEKLIAFTEGQIKRLVIKPKIGAWGLNWQHCNHCTMFPSHSFEQYYQAVRRFLRFGQERTVEVDMVTTHGEEAVLGNLNRKAEKADEMFAALLANMQSAMHIDRSRDFTEPATLPNWMQS